MKRGTQTGKKDTLGGRQSINVVSMRVGEVVSPLQKGVVQYIRQGLALEHNGGRVFHFNERDNIRPGSLLAVD